VYAALLVNNIKKKLAYEIVKIYHGAKKAGISADEFDAVFRDKGKPSDIKEIAVSEGLMNAVDILVFAELVSSKGEARRLVEQGGFKIEGEKVTDPNKNIEIIEEGFVIQAGKRRFAKITKK